MAHAEVTTVTAITLTLTEVEAAALFCVVGNAVVRGGPVQGVYDALRGVGVSRKAFRLRSTTHNGDAIYPYTVKAV